MGLSDSFFSIVILDPETNTQKLHLDGNLIRPVSILTKEAGDGTPRHHAVFEEYGRKQFHIKLVHANDMKFGVEVEAGERKRGEGQTRMLLVTIRC